MFVPEMQTKQIITCTLTNRIYSRANAYSYFPCQKSSGTTSKDC